MSAIELSIIEKVLTALQQGDELYLFSVISVQGASPRPVGSMMLFNKMQQSQSGSLSGGCIEEELLQSIIDGSLVINKPTILTYGITAEQTARLGLPCGGVMEILAEQLTMANHQSTFQELLQALQQRKHCKRMVDMSCGKNQFSLSELKTTGFQWNSEDRKSIGEFRLGPEFRLLLIGVGALASAVAEYAEPLGYSVSICDPRQGMQQQWCELGNKTTISTAMPDDFVTAALCDQHTAVLTLSHDPRVDDMALMAALNSNAAYVGALGSQRTSQKRRQRLLQLDLTADAVNRLHAPIGIEIGSKTPHEIAIAILADIIKLHRSSQKN